MGRRLLYPFPRWSVFSSTWFSDPRQGHPQTEFDVVLMPPGSFLTLFWWFPVAFFDLFCSKNKFSLAWLFSIFTDWSGLVAFCSHSFGTHFWRNVDGFLSHFAAYFAPRLNFVRFSFRLPLISLIWLLFVPTDLVHVVDAILTVPCRILQSTLLQKYISSGLIVFGFHWLVWLGVLCLHSFGTCISFFSRFVVAVHPCILTHKKCCSHTFTFCYLCRYSRLFSSLPRQT